MSTTVKEDPYGGVASADPSSSSAAEPRETVGEAAGERRVPKRDCGTIVQPDEFILNPMASINTPDFYTRTRCQASQPAGFNYCGACGAPIIPNNEIPADVQEEIRNIGAIIWPRSLAYRSTIGGASGKRLRTTPSELRFKQEDSSAFELNCKKL